MVDEIRTDWKNIQDGDKVILYLYPKYRNQPDRTPVKSTFKNGYFYCNMDNKECDNGWEWPFYGLWDVWEYCAGFTEDTGDWDGE